MKEHESLTGSSELPHTKDNVIREYFCIRAYLFAQDSFTDWFDHFHQKKPHMPKRTLKTNSFSEQIALEHAEQQYASDMERWKNSLELLVKTACDRLYNVLLFPEGGWLVDTTAVEKDDVAEAENADTDRAHQMSVLRSIYIPQVASLLQNVLHSSEHFKECIQLSDIVASEQHQLYKCFSTNELQRFLCKLQETSQVLLDNNMDALGYPLH
ncbi:nuclear pore complex protein Nup107 [Oratosquilla oratoria]|uniref:nuclear pore complex protein Nup107 n=1 Tax=Oratosquilla oratoria TaxID=337810 RepID=UPI003F76F10B